MREVEVIAKHLYTVWCCEADEIPDWDAARESCRDMWLNDANGIVNALLEAGLVIEERFKGAEL
jgi:hypothetical protein